MEINNDYSKNLFDIYSFSHISHGILLKIRNLSFVYIEKIMETMKVIVILT